MERGSRYNIPGWLDRLLPDVRPPVRICLGRDSGGVRAGLLAHHPDGTTEQLSEDIVRAYSLVSGVAGTNIEFSKGVVKRYSSGPSWLPGRGIWCPVDGKPRYSRLLLAHTDADRARLLEDAWAEFLECDRRWREEPTFYRSFTWLASHPAFWTRELGAPRPGEDGWSDEFLWAWETGGYQPELFVYEGKHGKAVVTLEAGAHVPETERWDSAAKSSYVIEGSYTEHYHDPRLDVSASTYEKAIGKLARRVDRFFDVDGSERAGVPYKLTQLEKTLRRRWDMPDMPPRHNAAGEVDYSLHGR